MSKILTENLEKLFSSMPTDRILAELMEERLAGNPSFHHLGVLIALLSALPRDQLEASIADRVAKVKRSKGKAA